MDLQHERGLVERAKSDPEAFGELYDLNYTRIFNYVLKRTASVDVSQDVTSDVFFKALKNVGQYRWSGVPFSSWLYRIANSEISNHYRCRNRYRELDEGQASNSACIAFPSAETEVLEAEAELRRHEEYLGLRENISKLSMKYQEVIYLRFFENKQIKEIGEILGKRDGTVKSLLHRALARLRELMR